MVEQNIRLKDHHYVATTVAFLMCLFSGVYLSVIVLSALAIKFHYFNFLPGM
jgi:hypothetical protein